MALGEHSSGTQAATAATEHNLATGQTTDGIYQVFVDTANLTGVNTVRIRVYEKIISSGTSRLVWDFTYGAGAPMPPSPALILLHEWRVTLTSTQSVSFPWSIRNT